MQHTKDRQVLPYSRRMSRFVYSPTDLLLLNATVALWTCKYGIHCATWIFRSFDSNTILTYRIFKNEILGIENLSYCTVTYKEYNYIISLHHVRGGDTTQVQGNRLYVYMYWYNPSWRKCPFLILKVTLRCLRTSLPHSKVKCCGSRTYDLHVISRRESFSMRLGATEMPPSGRSTHDSKPTTMAWVLDYTPLT